MVEQFTLPNGLRVVCERLPHLRSVSMGVYIRAGSVLESPQENGLSHFIEHMAFKGTQKRTAKQIAQAMDSVGGYLNATTSKLRTYYYAKVIDEDIALAADVLSDIVRFPAIDEKELDKERNVIIEEIGMVDDSPEDVVYDLIALALYGDQPLGQTILGPKERIAAYTRKDVLSYRRKHYGPMNACVSVAGNFDLDALKDLMAQCFGDWSGDSGECYPVGLVNVNPRTILGEKDTEQVHICLGYKGKPLGDKDKYAMAVFNSVFGGGMSSRLFQRVREESGMAYSVYSAPSAYPHCGEFTIYAATSPKNIGDVLAMLSQEVAAMAQEGMTEDEFRMAKAQLKGGFILGQESAFNRMSDMGGNLILLGQVIPADEIIRSIEGVTHQDANRVALETLSDTPSRAFVGKNIEELCKGL